MKKRLFYRHKCSDCGRCEKSCPEGLDPLAVGKDEGSCTSCGRCVDACHQGALALACEAMTVDEVVTRIKRDAIFYCQTGGGVTFSGLEPFIQPQFLRTLMGHLEALGIDMWAETCGDYHWESVEDLFEKLSCVFV
ncbi:MAG: 4Fe-4S binding protein, partial [Eubacterium aggregans]